MNSSFNSVGSPLGEAFYENEVSSRTFEQIITERGNLTELISDIYNNIRDKLFIPNEFEPVISEEKSKEYSQKWNIQNLHESIDSFKKDIGDLYQKKNYIEIKLSKNKEMYKTFCNHTSSLLEAMEPFYLGTKKQDEFRENIKENIEWFYEELDLVKLTIENTKITEELNFMKESLKKISSLSIPTQCPICYENQVSWFIDPCGHTLCEKCKEFCKENPYCHYCKTKKNKYSRLYYC